MEKKSTGRRFISSILGGDIPYGSRGHVLTQAERKEYPLFQSPPPSIKKESIKNPVPEIPRLISEDQNILSEPKPISLVTTKATSPICPPSSPHPSTPILQQNPIEEKRRPTATVEPQQQQNHQQELAVRCSVIKRLPQSTTVIIIKDSVETVDIKHPVSSLLQQQTRHIEPEQDQPIDYHIPKRRSEYDNEEFEKKSREARRSSAIISRPVLSMRHHHHMASRGLKVNGIMTAAAGHGRSNGNNTQNNSNQSNNSSNCGSFSGSGGGSTGGGASSGSGSSGGGVGGGTGAGGGMGGRDGRSNYGPNSPPTGSLPPFYESLKGGNNGMNAYNANNGNYMSSQSHGYTLGNGMDCDGSQELTNIGSYSEQSNNNISLKNYSMNAAYGLIMKDEQDLEYESKFDPLSLNSNLLQNGYGNYDMSDSMMVDMNGSGVDPLQFTATLTFSSPAEHALLDSLTDAVDLSSFLQRLPNDDHSSSGNDLELSSTPSLTPDSVSITPVDNQIDSYTEHLLMGRNNSYDRQQLNGYSLSNKMYNENPPSYQQSREMSHLMGGHTINSHHELISSGLNFELDQHSNMSLPSPSGASSLDGSQHGEHTSSSTGHKSNGSVQQSVSSRRNSSPLVTEDKLHVLSQRVSIK